MSRLRLIILVLGPIPIVAGALVLSRSFDHTPRVPSANEVIRPAHGGNVPVTNTVAPASVRPDAAGAERRFAEECRRRAESIARQLGRECDVVVRAPFVIGGDLNEEELGRWYDRTIGPAARAMAASYFSVPPDRPITVLLFSNETTYNHYATKLYGDEDVSVYGYYKPRNRTLVMNIGTGGGTLVHELTHALVDFDFPQIPDWFNEGLASLHEQCRFRDDESGIDGLENWRLPGLKKAIRDDRLRTIQSLITADDFRSSGVGLNYAQARYLCLYMQREDVLEDFYRRFRATHGSDSLGYSALRYVFSDRSEEELEADFRRFVLGLEW